MGAKQWKAARKMARRAGRDYRLGFVPRLVWWARLIGRAFPEWYERKEATQIAEHQEAIRYAEKQVSRAVMRAGR